MKWRFHPDAAEEYLEACHYYLEMDGKLGRAFTRSVELAIEQILDRPEAWKAVDEDVRRHLLKRFPYGIYYTIEDDFILVVAVMHVKRRPEYWRNRVG